MNDAEARTLFLDHCKPGDRGALERHGTQAAVAAIVAVTAHIEAEARRYAGHYPPFSDGRNTFVVFADAVTDLTAERLKVGRVCQCGCNDDPFICIESDGS